MLKELSSDEPIECLSIFSSKPLPERLLRAFEPVQKKSKLTLPREFFKNCRRIVEREK